MSGNGAVLGRSINKHLGFGEQAKRATMAQVPYTLVVDDLDNCC